MEGFDNRPLAAKVHLRTADNWYGVVTPPGWDNIIGELDSELAQIDPDYKIFQVKEKFGALRYYSSLDVNDQARKIVTLATLQSSITCEECGKKAELRTDRNWIRTLCNEHADPPVTTDQTIQERSFGSTANWLSGDSDAA
jgi:hypothetical protein